MSDVFDRIAARAAGAPAARLTERRDVWSAEPAFGVPGGAAPGAGAPGGGRWPAPAREEGPTPATPEGRASRPGGEGVATRAVGPGARPDGSASDLGAAGPSPSRRSGATVPDDVSAGPTPRARRGDPRGGTSAVDDGGAVAGRGGDGRGAVRPGATGPAQDRLEQGGPAPGRAGASALGARPEGDGRDAAPTDAAPTVAGPSDAAPTDAAPQRALLPGLAGAASALRLRGPGPETPPGGVRDAGAPEGPAPAPRRDGSARTQRDPASAAIAPEDLLREHVAPALAGRGVLDLAAVDGLAAPGLGPVEAPAGAVVHVHLERVDVHRPAPDPPRAAREGARVDHADYLARQQRRWR
ncbi:hypothetical protein [Isoptericola sp. NPDC057559]|uniref:hypothetical protein n=1 Tax=Isoptericola sp. NPDC057559 TaxID=3346168 RepID=UPI003679079D